MAVVVLVLHLVICIGLIALVLLQRSEGGALGMGGGGGGALMSGRGAADALARLTSIAGGVFLATSLGLTLIQGAAQSDTNRSVFDSFQGFQMPSFGGDSSSDEQSAPAPSTTPSDDPLESSAPEAAPIQEASLPADGAAAVAPAASQASERAGPVTPGQVTLGPAAASASTRPTQTASARSESPASTPAAQPAAAPAPRPAASSSSSSVASSVTVPVEAAEDDILAPVRREERAGPDQ